MKKISKRWVGTHINNKPSAIPTSACVSALIVALGAAVAHAQGDVGFGTDPFSEGEVSPLMMFLGELHPLAIHFPLALTLAATIFETLYIVSKREQWRTSAFHTLTLGAIVSLITIITGLTASSAGPFFAEDAETLDIHRLFGLTTAGLLLITTWLFTQVRLKKKIKLEWVFRVLLGITTVCVFIAGHFGAKLAGLGPF